MKLFIPGSRPKKAEGQLSITFKPRGEKGSQAYLSAALAQTLEAELGEGTLEWVKIYLSDQSPLIAIRPTSVGREGVATGASVLDKAIDRLMRENGALKYNATHRVVGTEDLVARYGIVTGKKILLVKTKIRLPGEEQEATIWAGSLALEGVE